MKTGLLTFYHIHHYGAMLQAYATERAVASLGSECEIIDYYVNQDNTLFQRPTGLGSAAHDAHTALHYGPLKARYERFEAFSRENLNISGRRYQSLEELRQAELPYDVLLSGSDQIWNPKIFPDGRFDPVFFGAFSHKRKIAYAPSFGIPRIPDGMEEELRTYLESFSHLSVRERQGQGIVRDITGKDVPVVLDPTLLLERTDWAAAARDGGAGRGYILCYCISRPDALAPYIRRLAEETGLPVVQLCGVRQKVHPKARCILSAGPAEFLGLFRDAAYVCTNSFHGTVFSVQFQKPFFTAVAPAEMAAPESSRTFSLLSRLGLGERIIGKGDTADLTAPIDWAAVGERLGRERKLSLDYLRCALEDRPHTPEEAPVKAEERPLPHLADHTHCTGCTACASGCPKDAITMERDREGFAYPVIDGAACVRCGHCTAVCPVLRERPQSSMPAVFAAWNRNDEIRRDSTSGGVFTLLAEYILESGGVVFGAAFDGSQHLRHTACFRKEELWRLRGAKYVQSDLGGSFSQVKALLEEGTAVLFSGVPCQVDGLKRYLGKDYPNLLTCDLVCHGVPSPAVFRAYLDGLEAARGSKVVSVRFKDKSHGWSHPWFTAQFADGSVYTEDFNRTGYGRGFGMQLFLRPACARCRYTSTSRPADFTLADYWGLDEKLALPVERDKGVSMVLVNSARGQAVFDALSPRFGQVERPLAEAVAGNPRLASPLKANPRRVAAFAALPFAEVEKRFLALPSLPYRAAAKVLTPAMKEKIRKLLK